MKTLLWRNLKNELSSDRVELSLTCSLPWVSMDNDGTRQADSIKNQVPTHNKHHF